MSARAVGRIWMDGHVELDSGAFADMAHRDDLARDVARLWPAFQRTRMNNPEATAESIKVWDELMAAFDRLAAAYGESRDH